MNKNWAKILKVSLLKSDKEKWGEFPIKRIEQSFDLNDDSELKIVKKFVEGEIKAIVPQIKHYKMWSPKVYHQNTYKFLEMEIRTLEIILKRLE